jgi:histone deacetylase 1/2
VSDVLHISMKAAQDKHGWGATEKVLDELQQLVEKGSWVPVHSSKLTTAQRLAIIRSSIFLKEKFKSTGEYDRLKARLVAGGNMQDKSLYEDLSSPTVATSSILICATIAAKEGRRVATFDIGGAFLHSKLARVVHMRIAKRLADLMVVLYPEYAAFQERDGSLVVELRQALYGLVEAANLWYENLSGTLAKLGYEKSTSDPCVFNKWCDGKQCTICLHVDDLFVTCANASALDELEAGLTEAYKLVTRHDGQVHSYIGMTFDYTDPGQLGVRMEGYVGDLLRDTETTGTAKTPAAEDLFEFDPESGRLDAEESETFHSHVCKLLYLAKRVRPDILLPVGVLASRVSEPTNSDMKKLKRVCRYVNGSRELGLVLKAGSSMEVIAFVDASYGVHADGKSVTGALSSLGGGSFHSQASKQKLNAKSSTEAELIGVSDYLSQIIWTRDFMIAQGYKMGPATLYQDNMSTMALIAKGRSTAPKTRHIHLRYFFAKDRVDAGEIVIRHMRTGDMVSDILTKPLQGAQFLELRDKLLGTADY